MTLKPTASYIFITTLATFDLISCLISMPLEIVDLLHFFTFESSGACRVLRFINYFAHIASGATLIAIAVDRFRKLCKPFERQISNRLSKTIVIIVIVFAIVSAWPSVVFNNVESVNITISGENLIGFDCSTIRDEAYLTYIQAYNAFLFFLFLSAIIVLVVLYVMVGRQLYALRSFRFYSTGNKVPPSRPMSTMTISSDVNSISGTTVPDMSVAETILEEDDDEEDAAIVEAFEAELRRGNLTPIEEDEYDEDEEEIFEEDIDDYDEYIENRCRPTSASSMKMSSKVLKMLSNKVAPEPERSEIKEIPIMKPIRQCRSFTENSRQIRVHHGPRRTKSEISISSRFRQKHNMGGSVSRMTLMSGLGSNYGHESSLTDVETRLSRCASVDIDESKMRAQNINTKKFTFITVCISIAFIVSFLPYLILATMGTFNSEHEANYLASSELVAYQIFVRSFLFNSVCNPLIYGLLNTEFKKMFYSGLKRLCCFLCEKWRTNTKVSPVGAR
ncbi:uncharacterized protein LOC110451672 [Mizuhopecten yessoensis]|uniref:uncharacterized protein LOC110451672 n=1 Tax=Mizuhopecten yessoensis TaxID=6573 RepID=UPI000B45D0FC|nr:uncharacterized protein LOC110451672 [Mizuhopecten yessoensis]